MSFVNSVKLKLKKNLSKRLSRKRLSKNLSTDAEVKDSNEIKLLELIETIKKYDYSNFKNFQFIGSGSFGSVVCASLKEDSDKFFALKSFNNNKTTLRSIVRELRLHKIIDVHENILRFYGITKIDADTVYQMNKYCLVLEYADGGTLNAYLNEHFNELNWNDKYQLAFQLTNALSYLHDRNIIHRDLHANNILVHKKMIKVADFGLSKEESEESSNASRIFGIIPYIDPKHFIIKNYKLNKKSDVYSIGVLLWQISSGYRPFCGTSYDVRLSLEIINGKREKIIENTPVEYVKIYTDCWNNEPDERPDIKQVVLILNQLINNKGMQTAELSYSFLKELQSMYNENTSKNEEVSNIYDTMNHLHKNYHVNKINPKDLANPARGKSDDRRGKGPNFIIKRIYKGQEVACKRAKVIKNLETLMKISECKHILRFYGISTIDDYNVMIFEWTERGTLRQLYETKNIKWQYKIQIALNICRGLTFLQKSNILHRDLKCQNILMTGSLEPKIYNFDFENTTSLNEDTISWLAPEKLKDFNSQYTTQCEIFSFGMLLWELTFEKIPYKGWKVEEIKDYVIKGGRERIIFETSTPQIYQEEYKKIINDTWKNNPQERTSFMQLLNMLEELYNSIDDNSLGLPDKTSDLDNDDLELPDEDIQVISLEEGIQAFKNKEHQKAWECFDFHAKNNNIIAKYWKGRYLWEGYLDGIKEREEGKELLKEAADKGNPDAQLRYAFTLVKILGKDDNRKIFMNYLTKAATEGNNSVAQFNLGDIYIKGKNNISKDKNAGIKWLRMAALQDNPKAIKLLDELSILFNVLINE